MRRSLGVTVLSVVLALGVLPAAAADSTAGADRGGGHQPEWEVGVVDADQSFRGLDAVDRHTAWVTGGSLTDGGPGRIYRTSDGGRSWRDVSPPGTEGLQFRDVEALGRSTAVVLAIGPGEASRIYRTTDAGRSWTESFRNTDEAAFYNCLDFYPGGRRGLAVSDPVDGKFRILSTRNGGRDWRVLPGAGMPDSTGEFNFAASGDCLVIDGHRASFGTGGEQARVFSSRDGGYTWRASVTPVPGGDAAGVFGLVYRWGQGFAVGGDFEDPADGADATAYTRPWRSEWTGGGDLTHLGEDASWLSGWPGSRHRTLVVVGESGDVAGTSYSRDGGRSFTHLSDVGFHTLDCVHGRCWAAGGGGRVGVLR